MRRLHQDNAGRYDTRRYYAPSAERFTQDERADDGGEYHARLPQRRDFHHRAETQRVERETICGYAQHAAEQR